MKVSTLSWKYLKDSNNGRGSGTVAGPAKRSLPPKPMTWQRNGTKKDPMRYDPAIHHLRSIRLKKTKGEHTGSPLPRVVQWYTGRPKAQSAIH